MILGFQCALIFQKCPWLCRISPLWPEPPFFKASWSISMARSFSARIILSFSFSFMRFLMPPRLQAISSEGLVKALPFVVHCRIYAVLPAGFHKRTAFGDLREQCKLLFQFAVAAFGLWSPRSPSVLQVIYYYPYKTTLSLYLRGHDIHFTVMKKKDTNKSSEWKIV